MYGISTWNKFRGEAEDPFSTWCYLSHLDLFLKFFFFGYYCHEPLGDNVQPKWGSKSHVSFMFQADVPVIFSQSKSTSCTHVD